jgi:DNA polymerase (family 10)
LIFMTNSAIALLLDEAADLLEIDGANSFRIRAYRNAARVVAELERPLATDAGELAFDPSAEEGIGKDLAAKIGDIVRGGTFAQLEELRAKIPAGVRDMLRLPGIGPKKVALLFKELKVENLDQLGQAARDGKVAALKGFGAKTQQAILDGLATLPAAAKRWYLAEARPVAEELAAHLKSVPGVDAVVPAGSARRGKETVGDLDLLCTASNSTAPMDALAGHPQVEAVLSRGETKMRVRLSIGIEMDLRVVEPDSFGAALQYFTGSKEHNIVVRKMAQERGLRVNEYGVFRGDERIAGRTEEEVYQTLGLPWVPPELREDRLEFEWAARGPLPELVRVEDIRGDLHMHTTATDGEATIMEMIEAAIARGREYIAITDHSKRVTVANGLDAPRLLAHWRNIDDVAARYPNIRVFKGIECDILEDATLDLPDDVLAEADWVIAVLHFGLRQTEEEIHARLMTAVRNPLVHMIGHPTARIVGKRPPVPIRWDEFLKAVADHGKLLEINANPARLDLDDVRAAQARDRGIKLVINTDAHSQRGMDVMSWGVVQARRAGLRACDVANTLDRVGFERLISEIRSS